MTHPQHDSAIQVVADAASTAINNSTPVKIALSGGAVSIVGGMTNSELIALIGAAAALLGSIWQGVLASQRRRDERERHEVEMRMLRAKADEATSLSRRARAPGAAADPD